MAKIKDKILKAAREGQRVTYKGNSIRLSADFTVETLWARNESHEIFSTEREKRTTKNPLPNKVII